MQSPSPISAGLFLAMPMDSFRKSKEQTQTAAAQRPAFSSGSAARMGSIAPLSPTHNSIPRPPRPASCDEILLSSTEDFRALPKQSTDLTKAEYETLERPRSSASFRNRSKEVRKELAESKKLRPRSSHDEIGSRSLSFHGMPDMVGSSQRLERIKPIRKQQSLSVVIPEDGIVPIKAGPETMPNRKLEWIGQDSKDRVVADSSAGVRRRYFVDMQNTSGSPRDRGWTNTMCHFDVYLAGPPADGNANDLRRLYYCDFLIPAPPALPPVPVRTHTISNTIDSSQFTHHLPTTNTTQDSSEAAACRTRILHSATRAAVAPTPAPRLPPPPRRRRARLLRPLGDTACGSPRLREGGGRAEAPHEPWRV
jgi:hypothetical protein